MNDQEQWLRRNDKYLSDALNWLRLRLRRLAGVSETSRQPGAPAAVPARRVIFKREEQPKAPPPPLPPAAGVPTEKEIAAAAAAMDKAADTDPAPALLLLSRRFGLSPFEQQALLLCAALELDTSIAALCASAQHAPNRPYSTFALFAALFDDPAWDVLSPERPLRFWRLIEINQPGAEPLTTSPLRADERIVNFIKGLNYLDDRLTPMLIPFDTPVEAALPPSQHDAAGLIERTLRQSLGNGPPPLVQLVGPDPLSKQLVAQQAAEALNLNLVRLPVELLPQQAGELETFARLWRRESILLPIALFVDAHEHDGEQKGEGSAPDPARPLQRFLSRSQGVFLLSTRELRSGLSASIQAVEVDKPTPPEQQAAWAEVLDTAADESPALLAGQFNLNTITIDEVARTTQADAAAGASAPLHEQLWDACLVRAGPQMDRLAQRLAPTFGWDDIVLPDDELHLLRQVANQVARRATVYDDWGFRGRMSRGLGISALFAGDSGTGKTMAAEVLANHLRLNLYRIDLSAVVSKYIGETEKNLRRLFDAAEDGGAILFFDEADALFGKRSEVRDSHDRYANIEINYLLQRMETYRGLAILATNMKSALDKAFMRRLRFVVTFPFPGRPQREAIWRRAWPADTPVHGLDYAYLSRFNLTGGSITNIALNAAFLAAEHCTPVTMPHVLTTARVEFRKLERPYNDIDFAWDEGSAPITAESEAMA